MFSGVIEREHQSEMSSRRERRGLYIYLVISYNTHTNLFAGSSLQPRTKIIWCESQYLYINYKVIVHRDGITH